jgi:hypothetical protein
MLKMQDIGKDEVGARGCYRNGEVTPHWAISARLPRRVTWRGISVTTPSHHSALYSLPGIMNNYK